MHTKQNLCHALILDQGIKVAVSELKIVHIYSQQTGKRVEIITTRWLNDNYYHLCWVKICSGC